jgi:hypothetical protein
MNHVTTEKKTLGQAIDEIIAALSALDEKARPTAIAAACAHLGLSPRDAHTPAAPASAPPPHPKPAEQKPSRAVDIRIMKDEKNPETATEMACLIAYYLQEEAPANEKAETVTIEEIKKYFKQAHFPLPKRIEQLLVGAKNAGYFDLVERGKYRLNAVGYNLAAHTLPRNQKSGG